MPARGLTKTDWLERLVALIGPAFVIWFFLPPLLGALSARAQDLYWIVFRRGSVSMLPGPGLYRGPDDIAVVLFPSAYLTGLSALWYLLIFGPEPLRQRPCLRRCLALAIVANWLVTLWLVLFVFRFGPHWWLALWGPVVVGWRALRRLS